ncbi:MAG: YceD family protein [Zoogloeaceae bacterium]|jgi:uncharacterized protein|nr:YceD family protein [Zoogloeaceae bacterium]
MLRQDMTFPTLDTLLDVWKFAREGAVLKGDLSILSLPRLTDCLAEEVEMDSLAALVFSLQGKPGKHSRPRLEIRVSGILPLRCQRCLLPVEASLDIDSLLELVAEETFSEAEEEQESGEVELLPLPSGKKGMRTARELLEEEILLALPGVPRHAECQTPSASEDMVSHSFAALSDWRRR